MSRPTVAIVGLGQIGGSFAAALTRRRLARVIGVTRRPVKVLCRISQHDHSRPAQLSEQWNVFVAGCG